MWRPALLVASLLLAGCAESDRPLPLPYLFIASADGSTATGPTSSIRVTGEAPADAFDLALVTWPERDPVAHRVESAIASHDATHTLHIEEAVGARWYAVIATRRDDREVRISSGVTLEDGGWAFRFRPDSAPRIRSLGAGPPRDGGIVDVDLELSEPVQRTGPGMFRLTRDGAECHAFDAGDELLRHLAFECPPGSDELVLTITEDLTSPGGGTLAARELRWTASEVYADPI